MSAVTAFALTTGLTSCGNEDEVLETEESTCQLELILDTGETEVSNTRATYSYAQGTGYENYVDPKNVEIVFYAGQCTNTAWNSWGTGSFVLKIKPDWVWDLGAGKYRLIKVMTQDEMNKIGTSYYRVVILANWPNVSTNGNNLANMGYMGINTTNPSASTTPTGNDFFYRYGSTNEGYEEYFTPSAETPIPMFGVKTVSGITFRKGKTAELGDIKLLRAMAKIEVIADESISISDVKLTKSNDKGMCAPIGMYVETSTPTEINIPGEIKVGTQYPPALLENLPFKETYSGSGDYVIYVPEYRNTGDIRDASASSVAKVYGESKITLKAKGKDSKETQDVEVEFKIYDDNGPKDNTEFNIIRNYHYIYKMYWSKAHVTLKYSVVPWDVRTASDITFE
jgi:hypothetical protein